ncbi:MAG: hypothetical protein AAFX39_10600 [Pseudomonadota bacterium]
MQSEATVAINREEQQSPLAAVDLISPRPVVVARRDGFFFCEQGQTRSIGAAIASTETNDRGLTRQLLAGCIHAARKTRHASAPQPGTSNLVDHVHSLCAAYQTTHATPPTLRYARDRFLELGDQKAADFAEEKAVEETGHDRLALKDLEALGLPADRLVQEHAPQRAKALVALFKDLARGPLPYGVFGYAYVLERLAAQHGQHEIDTLQSLAPQGVDISRCARVHSSLGADLTHVQELVDFVAEQPSSVRADICRAVYDSASVMFADYDYQGEKRALQSLLDGWNWRPFGAE